MVPIFGLITYDRKLTDIFSVESEVAKAIADQLRAKLTGQEEQVIAAKPTDNPEAYDAYLRGLAYILKAGSSPADDLAAQKYLREAVRLDPKFALGWALLSWLDAAGYRSTSLPPTIALREEARQAAETALTLQPNLGEAVLAKGEYHYACLRDYDTAMRYFEQARQLLPNSSLIFESLAYLERRRGQWDRSELYFNEAERLDPRNAHLLTQHALTYKLRRRFPEALRKFDQVLDITPDDVDTLAQKAVYRTSRGRPAACCCATCSAASERRQPRRLGNTVPIRDIRAIRGLKKIQTFPRNLRPNFRLYICSHNKTCHRRFSLNKTKNKKRKLNHITSSSVFAPASIT